MKCLFLAMMIIFGFSALAETNGLSLGNTREGHSFYRSKLESRGVSKLQKRISSAELKEAFETKMSSLSANSACAHKINNDIFQWLSQRSITRKHVPDALFILRRENALDDVSLKILLKAFELKTTIVSSKIEEELFVLEQNETTQKILNLIANFELRMNRQSCFDESYRGLYSDILRLNKKVDSLQLEAFYYQAFKDGRITEATYVALEQGRLNELHLQTLSIAEYFRNSGPYVLNIPYVTLKRSDFVSAKVKRSQSSRRQRLFENYNEMQIILMGNVIKKLRQRLEYDAVTISGYKEGVLIETIPLEPMERFRFAIKALRKEMSLLSLNSFFNGRTPEFMELMTASYELSIIPASELEAVASLEEIWNPQKTFWDKASIWVRMFSSVATIVIPPPYGFIPALVLVAIEASTHKKKDPNTNDPTSMF